MEWYNDFPHIGYNLDGNKVMRPAQGDELDQFLERMDNPDFWYVYICVYIYTIFVLV